MKKDDPIRFYGYKHWTLEDPPRCFNVGKGTLERIKDVKRRGRKWHHIVKRLGLHIEKCFGPVTEAEALAWETIMIRLACTRSYSHAHDNDIGCNLTDGGDGESGRKQSPEERAYRSRIAKERCAKGRSPEHCLNISRGKMGHKVKNNAKWFCNTNARGNRGHKYPNRKCPSPVTEETRAKHRANTSFQHTRNRCATWFAKQMAGVE